MANERQKLTKRTVDAARVTGREYTTWDSELRGFGLRVRPSGRKAFVVVYRAGSGRAAPWRRFTIGEPGEALTAAQAREIAGGVLAGVRLGQDPAGDRTQRRNEPTISDICDRYLTEHVAAHNKPSTADRLLRLVENRIKPSLGKLQVSGLSRSRVKQWHHDMAHRAKPGAAPQFTPYEANRCLATLSKIMSLASKDWELRADNPCRGIQRFPEQVRDRFYTADELKAIASALDAAARENTELPGVLTAVRLLALTGCRLGEILNLRWDQVDFDRRALRLQETKTGARVVTIGAPAVALLSELDRVGAFVVPGADPAAPLTVSAMERAWRRLRKAAGIPDGRLHDFRHTVGTYAGQAGMNAFTVRDILGHRTLAMTGRYVERADDPARVRQPILYPAGSPPRWPAKKLKS